MIISHYKRLCAMAFGGVWPYGPTCKTPLNHSYYLFLHPASTFVAGLGVYFLLCHFKPSNKLSTVYFVLTCKIKLSNLSYTTWFTCWALTSLTLGSYPSAKNNNHRINNQHCLISLFGYDSDSPWVQIFG